MYDHTKQYRCTIIRGKSKKEMDDLLPAYALVIDEICPCSIEDFDQLFNNSFQRFLPASDRIKKTLDNHRTEISGKLFGMYYISETGTVYESERTLKYLEDSDQPAFFKDICYKMQFPNGMDKMNTLEQRMSEHISIRPNSYVLKILQLAQTANIDITIKDIGYYILNSLDVLQGNANPYEVIEAIANDRKVGIQREIVAYDDNGEPKASSYTMQHIREQLNYLELANLIRITPDKRVILNPNEIDAINLFTQEYNVPPEFDVYTYDFGLIEEKKSFKYDWSAYYAKLSRYASEFVTSTEALAFQEEHEAQSTPDKKATDTSTVELGDEGENIVYEYEKNRVAKFNARLVNKVLPVGKTKGIGYDIQSVIAEPGDMEEFVKYIEVKSTKRFTTPDPSDDMWVDTLNITRNEWVAAQQHGQFYSIARVYITGQGVTIFMLTNISEKLSSGKMKATPMTYRIDFSNTSVDQSIAVQQNS